MRPKYVRARLGRSGARRVALVNVRLENVRTRLRT